MRSPELIQRIQDSMTLLIESSDELRDLDQVLGDGDLGITISAGAARSLEALKDMPTEPEPAPSDVARAARRHSPTPTRRRWRRWSPAASSRIEGMGRL